MTALLPAFTQTQHETLDPFINRVFCCDALDLLRSLPDASVDMVLCDLPYGVTACKWDSIIPIAPMWGQLKRIAKQRAAIVLTATQPFTSRLVSSNYEMFRYEWIWEKNQFTHFLDIAKMPMKAHESILVFYEKLPTYNPQMVQHTPYWRPNQYKRKVHSKHYSPIERPRMDNKEGLRYPTSILPVPYFQPEMGIHPTQKPVALFEYLIKTYTQEGEVILDMTCGSGTTGIAATKTNRRYILGDNGKDDRTGAYWADIARKRIQDTDPYQPTELDNGHKQLSLFSNQAS